MANKSLQSIKFPGLSDTYVVPQTDDTLSIEGRPADAKATGDAISNLTAAIAAIGSGISDIAKAALLACFQHVAWMDEHGQNYYDALESALYADQYPKITATFNPGTNIIYTDDALSTLKQYLTVKYYESASDSGTTVLANDYTLTGVLTAGTSTVLATYDGLTTAFTVEGVVDFYNTWEWGWTPTGGNLTKLDGGVTINNSKACINSTNNTMRTTRRAFCAERGIDPYIDTVTLESRGVYPIPIPKTANKVTLSISPSERQVFGYLCKYDSANNTYSNTGGLSDTISFTNGSGSLEFTPDTYQYLMAGTRHSASGTYTEEPTSYNILFEVVQS